MNNTVIFTQNTTETKLEDLIKSITELKTSNAKITSSLNSHIEKINRLDKKIDDLFKNFSILMEENRYLKLKIVNIEERISCIENNKTQIQQYSFEHDTTDKLMDRQVKSNNVILFNLPENKNGSDLENIKNIFTALNENIEHFTFYCIRKIKSTIPDRPQPVSNLTDQSDIFTILQTQKNLKNSTKWSNIHFSSDKIMKQRDEMANLRRSLQNRRKKDKNNGRRA
ncbi:uncharacterized protein LOC114128065 [Aphis gossypii]|uniref:uncharacterized protein LOC114128065 n=1 Tax=Aphis gossypii TaxID=80765 RepID=UPI00215963C0|nr:uncharacterized protein LOC114128065 [Aphis gossypii]